MTFNRLILAAISLLLAVGSCAAQTWTFEGTQICYSSGATSQCYSRGTLRGYVDDRATSARRAGQGAGSLAGLLIAAWLKHRKQVRVETDQLAKELQAYFDGEFELIEDQQVMELEDQRSISALQELDSRRSNGWQRQLDSSKKLYDERAKYLSDLKGLFASQMKEKRRKALRYFIDHDPDGAKARYARELKMAARSYVDHEFMTALLTSYEKLPPKGDETEGVDSDST